MTILDNPNSAWEYDGVDLNTYAYSVRVLGASEQVPARRGENIIVGGRSGRLHIPKIFDERTLALGMFVSARNPSNPDLPFSSAQFLQNVDKLKELFARDGVHVLKHKMADVTRIAFVEVSNLVEFVPKGPYHYDLVVEFTFADPFWYAENPTTLTNLILFTPFSITVLNEGTYKSEKIQIQITGFIENPMFEISGIWCKYNGIVNAGQTLIIDTNFYEARLDSNDVSGQIDHDNSLRWLEIPVGLNTLTIYGNLDNIHYPVFTMTFEKTYI
jgi:hypothetical protein